MITLEKLLVYIKMFNIYYCNNCGGDKTSEREESNISLEGSYSWSSLRIFSLVILAQRAGVH